MVVKNKVMVTTVTKARPYIENIHYQVVHSCPGRLRIRIPQLAEDSEYVTRLKSLVESLAAVHSVRLNPTASSMVVEYGYTQAVASDIVQKVFTAIKQAASADTLPQGLNNLPTPLNTDVSNSSATSQAADDSAVLTAKSKSLGTPLHGKTPQEYSLLVRGNYSISARLESS